ncbi:5-formyltetrahydrofolate cyclo-ligase [Sedimentitalea sp. JM2-8]|uniref:5-formyltetrahydrofolate cyclo-ligase n=1 Tax=Sedimentitalea xiamensis TaxID=3050037 RepID=A0ABT7FKH8_9RHOB|nr:5-formyltetrahydrofolate cyclo-ligase [Sedimentitalea xiamensis]
MTRSAPTLCLAHALKVADGYRRGPGGGCFDRTLAAPDPKPFMIGIGPEAAQRTTVYPRPHDIRLALILTEKSLRSG